MILKKWEELPDFMQTEEVRPYYEVLKNNKLSLILKRVMDLVGGMVLLVLLAIPMAIIAVMIKLDSEGPIFYRQELLKVADDVDKVYLEEVLPGKMKYNLQSIKEFSFIGEIATMFRTIFAVLGKDYSDEKEVV